MSAGTTNKIMKRKVINTCMDGTCRTIVAWYAKGGRSNFAAWNGTDRFLMTAILEEYEPEEVMNLKERFIVDHQGYGKADPRPGSHMVCSSSKKVSTTLTTFCGLNKAVIEVYEEEDDNSDSE